MFAAAPVRGDDDTIVGFIGLRIRPSQEFTEILNVARFGETGETYAFDKQGLLLSASRFEDQLRAASDSCPIRRSRARCYRSSCATREWT